MQITALFDITINGGLFTCPESYSHETLRLYYAETLSGPWIEHPQSPISEGNAQIARLGGKIIDTGDRLIIYIQD